MLSFTDLKKLNLLRQQRKFAFLVHDFFDGMSKVYSLDDIPCHFISQAALAKQKKQAFSFSLDDKQFFISPYLPTPQIIIIGAVHISQYLVPMIKQCGYDAIVVDPRQGFASTMRFPDTSVLSMWPEDYFANNPMGACDGLVVLSHNPDIDDGAIFHAIQHEAFYVGALGSKKNHAKRLERLSALGLSPASLSKIHGPIGLDINASTPQEIAVAILAQIIQNWRQIAVE